MSLARERGPETARPQSDPEQSEMQMTPSAVLIQQPAIDFTTLLGLSHKMLGYNLAGRADQSHIRSDSEKFISCLAALRDPNAPAGVTPNLLTHVSFSALIAADERDLIDILEAAAGMPFVSAETTMRGVMVAIITGTMAQWRDAVKSGASPAVEFPVRACYCQIMSLFEQVGLNVWRDFQIKPHSDKTFFLEDKRR